MDGWQCPGAGSGAERGAVRRSPWLPWSGGRARRRASRAPARSSRQTGDLLGWIGGACAEPVVLREARQVIADGTPRLLLLGTPEQFGEAVPDGMTVVPIACQSEGSLEVYIEPVLPVPHLVVVGRSPMAHTLTDLAGALGWRAELIDGPDFTAADADERSMVVVATQGHGDEEAVEQAVAARPAYLGLVGSHRRGASVLGYLADRGVPADQLGRVRVPVGLDLGHTSHREIAVAVLAELVQLRASGALAARSAAARPEPEPAGTRPGPSQPGPASRDHRTARPHRPGLRHAGDRQPGRSPGGVPGHQLLLLRRWAAAGSSSAIRPPT